MTDVSRTVSGIIFDSEYTIPSISNKGGFVMKTYVDAEVDKIVDLTNVIPYKIETDMGNLAGFFSLQTVGTKATLLQFQLRPAFQNFNADISQIIGNFILSNNWIVDILI